MEETTINTAAGLPGLKEMTDWQAARAERDLAIYKEWKESTENEGQSRTNVVNELMRKYGLYSNVSIYRICARVRKRLDAEKKKQREARS